jgi:hypothetical protein
MGEIILLLGAMSTMAAGRFTLLVATQRKVMPSRIF